MARRNRPLATARQIVAAALIVIVAGSCGSGAGDDVQATEIEFELLNEGTATVGDFLDRPVVLNFFASWCPPCITEMPALESVQQQRADIAFVGLAYNDTPTRAREIVADTGVTYPTGIDPGSAIGNAYGIQNMPTTLFITPDGEVAYRHIGGLTADQITEHIDTHLTP
ncbi:TlpA family protein disulfide reductase [Candidatus Poriferisocius sp.]|uniref:TlpA family protein disulfide reductase n=1 Tax=Candidatus Poriferisocius sp. TaxID=3101276 RepID=UPI003B0272F9